MYTPRMDHQSCVHVGGLAESRAVGWKQGQRTWVHDAAAYSITAEVMNLLLLIIYAQLAYTEIVLIPNLVLSIILSFLSPRE